MKEIKKRKEKWKMLKQECNKEGKKQRRKDNEVLGKQFDPPIYNPFNL